MQAVSTSDVDLADIAGFWTRPPEERARTFSPLRARPGLPYFDEPESPFPAEHPGFYAVTRYDDVVEASRRPDVFISGKGSTGIADVPPDLTPFSAGMIDMDDPMHARMRRIVARGFTARRLAELQRDIDAVAADIISRAVETGRENGGRIDVATDLAARLPLEVIYRLVGRPRLRPGRRGDRR